MVLRYWHDRRVGKGTNKHGNGFALSTYVLLLLLRFTTYSHPTFGFATAHALNVECCVGPDTPCAPVPPSPSLRCAHWSAASVLAIARRQRCRYPIGTFALVRRRTRATELRTALPLPSLSSLLFLSSPTPDPYYRHPDTC